jgi:hypothetical protein
MENVMMTATKLQEIVTNAFEKALAEGNCSARRRDYYSSPARTGQGGADEIV